jgi:hypothetical protein
MNNSKLQLKQSLVKMSQTKTNSVIVSIHCLFINISIHSKLIIAKYDCQLIAN